MNFHHLRIFWVVAKEGSLRAASQKLHLTQPTMSTQIHQLEDALGEPLFLRTGRRLVLTAAGRMTLEYAEEIFSLGRELESTFTQGLDTHRHRLHVGISSSLPKLVARELLRPAFQASPSVRIVCHEGRLDEMAVRLGQHRLQILLSDEPLTGEESHRATSHRVAESGVTFCAVAALRRPRMSSLSDCLATMPLLLPAPGMPLRRSLDAWFQRRGIQPRIAAEFDDTALLKDFAADGVGIAPVHTVAQKHAQKLYGLKPLGIAQGLRTEFFAISAKHALRHPLVSAILEQPLLRRTEH